MILLFLLFFFFFLLADCLKHVLLHSEKRLLLGYLEKKKDTKKVLHIHFMRDY